MDEGEDIGGHSGSWHPSVSEVAPVRGIRRTDAVDEGEPWSLSFGGEWKVLGFKASVREVHDGTRMPGTKASVREVHEGTGDSRGLDAETESRGPSCGIRP